MTDPLRLRRRPHALAAWQAAALAGVMVLTVALSHRTAEASFSARTDDTANSVGAAAQFCASAGPVAVTTAVDTTLYQAGANAGQNYSTSVQFGAGSGTNANARGLIKFALPSRPPGCVMTSASLSLRASPPTSGAVIDVYRVAAAWDVSTVTWNTRPPFTGSPASSASLAAVGRQTWNVTALVTDLYTGPDHGFLIKDSLESAGTPRYNIYDSMEASTASSRPVLTITWD